MYFDRTIFFDTVRPLFGSMDQAQVDGLEAILLEMENVNKTGKIDNRWFGYELATTHHETGAEMRPIREGFKATDEAARKVVAKYDYGKPDPQTGQVYYGRGYVQLTWKENYKKQGDLLGADFVNDPDLVMEAMYAFPIMHGGMVRGDFRKGHTLSRYFNDSTDDPFGAREIINGDKNKVPAWDSKKRKIGTIIKDYYMIYTAALNLSEKDTVLESVPQPPVVAQPAKRIVVIIPKGMNLEVEVREE